MAVNRDCAPLFFPVIFWGFFFQVNGRIISKQIHVRVEHVSPSKCRDELKRRVKENEAAKKDARAGGGECARLFFSLFYSDAARHDGCFSMGLECDGFTRFEVVTVLTVF